ncbi:hypothetical protein Tco_0322691 [Tanacetum coccineum]
MRVMRGLNMRFRNGRQSGRVKSEAISRFRRANFRACDHGVTRGGGGGEPGWATGDGETGREVDVVIVIDLSNSGLEEFQEPEFEGYGPKTSKSASEDISNEVRKSNDAPLVEKLVSDDKSEKKIVFPTVAKIEFVKSKQQEKPVRKPVKYAEMYRSQKPRGNQRNWNNQKSQQLGNDFVMHNKACYVCGSFDHLQYTCKQKRQLNGQREEKPVWNNARRVNHQNSPRITHPNPKRHMVPRKILTRSGPISLNTARQSHFNAVRTNRVNAVKASACWVWRPIKPNSASITLKRYDYVDGNPETELEDSVRLNSPKDKKIKLLIKKLEDLKDEHQVQGRIVGIKKPLMKKLDD